MTPLAQHCVPNGIQATHGGFRYPSAPVVFDLSPGILGPSEGFSKAFFEIFSSIGFDESRHTTWKVRPSSRRGLLRMD